LDRHGGVEGDGSEGQDIPGEYCAASKCSRGTDLEKDVASLGAIGKDDLGSRAGHERGADLEDKDA